MCYENNTVQNRKSIREHQIKIIISMITGLQTMYLLILCSSDFSEYTAIMYIHGFLFVVLLLVQHANFGHMLYAFHAYEY
jgi:hypothetical protein